MEPLELRKKALDLVANSTDLKEIKTALEIANLAGPGDAAREGARSHPVLSSLFQWAGKQTALLAVIITAVTLLAQIVQFYVTGQRERKAASDAQWYSAVSSISLSDTGTPLAGALNVSVFYDSDGHGIEARALVATSLPYIQDTNAFDLVFFDLMRHLRQGDDIYPLDVAKSLSLREQGLYKSAGDLGISSLADKIYCPLGADGFRSSCFRKKVSEVVAPPPGGSDDRRKQIENWVAKARTLDWEIDSATSGIVGYWNQHRTIGKSTENIDFRGIVLRYDGGTFDRPLDEGKDGNAVTLTDVDLSGSDFSDAYISHLQLRGKTTLRGATLDRADLSRSDFGNADLTGAHFDGATIDCADLSHVVNFQGSTWKGVDVSNAILSPELEQYIQANFASQASSNPKIDCGAR